MLPPSTAICQVYLAPYKFMQVSSTVCRLMHEIRGEHEKGEKHEIEVLTISSSEQCIAEIKSYCAGRKYKSCLSFSPSEVRHISILSGESTSQKYRGFINLIVIMFIVLNLRNIYDNFVRYGIRFLEYPLEFVPYSATIGFFYLFIFIELAYRLDKLRFHRILSDKLVVLITVFREYCLKLIRLVCCSFCICFARSICYQGQYQASV